MLAAVIAAIKTQAGGRVGRGIRFAGAGVNDVRIDGIHGDRSDRICGKIARSKLPLRSVGKGLVGAPNATAGGTYQEAALAVVPIKGSLRMAYVTAWVNRQRRDSSRDDERAVGAAGGSRIDGGLGTD